MPTQLLLLFDPLKLCIKLRLHLLQCYVRRVLSSVLLWHRRVASSSTHRQPRRRNLRAYHRPATRFTDPLQLVHHPLILGLHLL
jgi:hypothetical protein